MRKVIFLFSMFFQSYSMDYEEIDRFYKRAGEGFSGDISQLWKALKIAPKDYPQRLINNIARQFYIRYYQSMILKLSEDIDRANDNEDVLASGLSLDPNGYGLESLTDTLKSPILLSRTDYNLFLQVLDTHLKNKALPLSELMFASVIRSNDDVNNSRLSFEKVNWHIGNTNTRKTNSFSAFKNIQNNKYYWLSSGIIISSALVFYFWNKEKK